MLRPWLAHQAKNTIRSGGIVAYPTEAVYGLGVHPEMSTAVMRLLHLKHRDKRKGLIVVASGVEQIIHYIYASASIDWPTVQSTWPGPVTWVFPASKKTPTWLKGDRETIAIRISAHPLVRSLCEAVGPIVSTSANPESCRPAKTAHRVRSYFGDSVDLLIPGDVGGLTKPTEIRDAITARILRPGQVNQLNSSVKFS